MNRRDFIHRTCQACAALAVAPLAASIEGCASASNAVVLKEGVAELPLSLLNQSGRATVKVEGLANKLLIVQRPDGDYTALELICPHKNGPLKEKEGRLVCEWHGSTFDLEGALLKGPSKSGLKRYPVEKHGGQLRVLLV